MLVRNFITLVYIFNIHTDEDLSYESSCKISVLASLCLAWKLKLSEMPPLPGKTWGVSVEELHAATCTFPGMCQDQFFADLIFRGVRGSGHGLAVRLKGYIA